MGAEHGDAPAAERRLKTLILFASPLENPFLTRGTIYRAALGILAGRSLAVFTAGALGQDTVFSLNKSGAAAADPSPTGNTHR